MSTTQFQGITKAKLAEALEPIERRLESGEEDIKVRSTELSTRAWAERAD